MVTAVACMADLMVPAVSRRSSGSSGLYPLLQPFPHSLIEYRRNGKLLVVFSLQLSVSRASERWWDSIALPVLFLIKKKIKKLSYKECRYVVVVE
jgi:hypothetical protein